MRSAQNRKDRQSAEWRLPVRSLDSGTLARAWNEQARHSSLSSPAFLSSFSWLLEWICDCVGRHHPGFGHHALPGAFYLRDETSFVSLPVLVSLLLFVPSISISVRTAPSILLSVVRYGRTRSEYLRPSLSFTF